MRFPRTVMFGNRLNCWKTIPIRLRTLLLCFSSAGTSLPWRSMWDRQRPATVIVPAVTGSRHMSNRRIVVFPEPDGPISVTCSAGATVNDRSESTTLSP